MNRLRLEHRLERESGWPDSVWTALFADGQEITSRDWPSVTDLRQLQASTQADGEYFIFTCTCGEAGCAGISEPVTVRRDAAGVHWRLGDAWRFIGLSLQEGIAWEDQVQNAAGGAAAGVAREFVFAPEQYVAAIAQDIQTGQALLARLGRFVTFTPDANIGVLHYPDLLPAAALARHGEEWAAWRAEHPLPPAAARRRRWPQG